MLKLLTCTQGHYWEKHVEDEADGQHERCPVCGHAAEAMPLLDESASEQSAAPAEPRPPAPLRDREGRPVIAGYEILHDLGKGPTGVHLYRARQLLVNRTVVLKVVFAGEDPGQFAWGSLRGEAGALGRLAHPNIVPILDAGERERQLFYNAIEHVEGPTLAEAMNGKPLPVRQAVALVETLARAMQHAHECNVVHRSLKPASVLLQAPKAEGRKQKAEGTADETAFRLRPSAFSLPKITDFGLARRPVEGDATDVELQGELPCYLSPEQAWGRVKEIGPGTDVYGLGAILYEALTGEPPFRGETVLQTLDAIQYRGVRTPSTLRAGISADLDAICRKCLAKQPRRRYASARELAEDLRRLADGYPVRARSPSGIEILGRWTGRHIQGVALTLLALWGIVALLALTMKDSNPAGWRSPREAGNRQATARLETELFQLRQREAAARYLRDLLLAERAIQGGEAVSAKELLERCPADQRHWEWFYLRDRLRKPDGTGTVFSTTLPATSADLSRDGVYLAIGAGSDAVNDAGSGKGVVSVWEAGSGARVWSTNVAHPVRAVAFSPDSSRLAFVTSDGKSQESSVHVYGTRAGRPAFAARRYPKSLLTTLAYSPDSMWLLVAGSDSVVRTLEAVSGREVLVQQLPFRRVWPRGGRQARLTPLGRDRDLLALISPDGGQLLLLPYIRRDAPTDLQGHDNTTFLGLAYDEHGETLAAGCRDQTVRLWNVEHPYQTTAVLRGHRGAVTGVSFSSDGKRLATCSDDGTVRIWDPEQGYELLTLKGYSGATGVVFSRGQNEGMLDDMRLSSDSLAIIHGEKVTVIAPSVLEFRANQ